MQIDSNRLFDFTGFNFVDIGVTVPDASGALVDKPYRFFVALTEEEEHRFYGHLSHAVGDVREQILKEFEETVFTLVPIGRTLDDEMVLLMLRGMVNDREKIHWECVLCPGDDLKVIYHDLKELYGKTITLSGDAPGGPQGRF